MRYKLIFVALFLVVFVTDAYAMRCSRKLIQVGDHISKMFNYCGNPDTIRTSVTGRFDRIVVVKSYTYEMNGRTKVVYSVHGTITSIRSI